MKDSSPTIWTIGHSTRALDELIAALKAHGVETLIDVRTIPRSRRVPHFNAESLADELPKAGIEYAGMKSLGGLRHPSKDSINTAWRNDSFRGYADYMQTPEFEAALNELIDRAARTPTAIMCAEAVPWRCHRSLIADALTSRGWNVLNIFDAGHVEPHRLTKFARITDGRVTYPDPSMLFDR